MGRNTDAFRRFLASDDVIVLDSAMGTELNLRGVRTELPLWSAIALMEAPDVVRKIHCDNIEAGARVITTNTFRTSVRTLGKAGLAPKASRLTARAVNLASLARRGAAEAGIAKEGEVFIAGSIAPLEDCYSPGLAPAREEARKDHTLMAEALAAAGADLLLVETMGTLDEARGAVEAAVDTGLPVMAGFTLSPEGAILDGAPLEDAVKAVEGLGAAAVMLNCFPAPAMDGAVERLRGLTDLPVGAYANMGIPDDVEGWEAKGVLTPEKYALHARRWIESGARIVGGCCGTGPEHVRAISGLTQLTDRN